MSTDSASFDFDLLSRAPDVEAENLQAFDAADRLLLDTAAGDLADAARQGDGAVVVVGDSYGALTLGAAALHSLPGIRVQQDPLSGELALKRNAERLGLTGTYSHSSLEPALASGARLVLLRLPRSLDALEEIARLLAVHAAPDVRIYAGGRIKHMTTAMNDVLGRYFGSVTASLARQKSRVLTVSGPLPEDKLPPDRFPLEAAYDVGLPAPLQLRARGAAFGGASLDPGTRFLLPFLARARAAGEAVDLGCGNGAIAAYLALARPGIRVLASDQSEAAAASTKLTLAANGIAGRAVVERADALSWLPDRSQDLVVLNPPFHIGASVHTGIAFKLFSDAARVLRPGGELWTVWNSHLAYKPALNRLVGPTEQVARNPRFTVTVTSRR
ncbi:class I SAM-dependent methyltransferase [Arthrobacter koreensis]|uniref:class I SAM-dependent methyltransferase n=1 Tax=Arthrobacter koreensis TaxID=199136 RepID=UPI002DBDA4A4|nr:methyltransferase [Arthrobacter koreensis]MEB7504830.1 methyltransferase [Arthrobacter koreensis]